MTQLSLTLDLVETGEGCRKYFTADMVRRIHDRYDSRTFYALRHHPHTMCTWCGGGQKPVWVQEWLAKGGTLKEIEIKL